MEHWDPQMMLDLYIHNYLTKKNMHTTAETFVREANVSPKAVAIDLPEGFLSEWWSIFWSVYSARLPNHDEAIEDALSMATNDAENVGYVPQIVHPVMPSSNVAYMLQNMCPTPQTMGHHNLLHNVGPITMPSYQRERTYKNPQLSITRDGKCGASFWRSTGALPTYHPSKAIQFKTQPADIGSRMREQEHLRLPFRNFNSSSQLFNVDQFASLLPSSSNFSYPSHHPPKAIQLIRESADTDARMCEQERLRLLTWNSNSNSGLLDVDQLAPFLPSSSNFSHPQKNKKRQLSVTGDNNCGTSLRRYANHAPKAIPNEMELANTGFLDARIHDEGYLRVPVGDLNPNSQLLDVDQLALLFSSSSNCSHTNAYGKSQVSVNRDGRCGTSMRGCAAAQPKAIQSNTEPAGSSTSSNSTRSDPSS